MVVEREEIGYLQYLYFYVQIRVWNFYFKRIYSNALSFVKESNSICLCKMGITEMIWVVMLMKLHSCGVEYK